MKRTLALLLVLATLLCLVPVAVSAEETAEPVAQSEGSYLDLYVKEGLVALYDAYSGVAADAFEGTASWYAVDFYEKEGYDDYATLGASKADLLAGVNMRWKWENGYLVKSSHTNTPSTGGTGHRDDNFSFIRLNTLGAQLLADVNSQFTIQQVYQFLGGITQDIYLSTPKVENGVVVNASTITAYPYTYSGGFTVGDLGSSYDYHTWIHDGKFTQGGVWRAKFDGCYDDSVYFLGEYYNVLQGADSSNASRWVRMGETGIVEETITRTSSTRYDVDFRHGVTYTNGAVWTNFPCTIASPAGSTEITLQRGMRARVYSIRIYNRLLSDAEEQQNHLADLLGAYGVNDSRIFSLTEEELAVLIAQTATMDLPKEASEVTAGATALTTLLNTFFADLEAVREQAAIAAQKDARLALYVKGGLVAMFDGNNSTATAGKLTTLAPVNFYGKEGYGAYIDPSRYTADIAGGIWDVLEWYYEDGSIAVKYNGNYGDRSTNSNYFECVDLSDLAAIIGNTYTVQETFTYAHPEGAPTVSDGVVTYTPKITNDGFRFDGKHVFGPLSMSTTYMKQPAAGSNGVAGGYSFPYVALNTGGAYRGHHLYAGEAYGAPEYANLGYVGGDDITMERSVMRKGYTSDGAGNFTSTFQIFYQKAPLYRTGNPSWLAHMNDFTYSSTSEAEHTDSTLHIMANTGAYYYGVRIYNKVLTDAELAQNHFADLVNFYKVNVADLSILSAEQLAELATLTVDIQISRDATKATLAKSALKNAISDYAGAIKEAIQKDVRLGLYVKDGLAAMFDGNNSTATAGKLTALTPVNFYGKEGYSAYIDPSRYTADIAGGIWDVLEWYYEDGSIAVKYNGNYGDRSTNSNYFECVDLSDLAAIIGNTYTVQETFTYAHPEGAPTVSDGVVTYTPKITNDGFRFDGKHVFGPLSMSTTYMKQPAAGSNGVAGGYSFPYVALNTGGAYRGHHLYAGEAYGAPEYANLGYVGGDDITMERSVIRNGYVKEEDNTFTSSFAIYYAKEPLYRTGNYLWVDDMNAFTYNSADEAEHTDSTLHIMANTGVYYYGVRVYSKALTDAELAQNHMADLVNFYKIDVTGIENLSAKGIAFFAEDVASCAIVSDENSDAYATNVAAIEAALEAAFEADAADTAEVMENVVASAGLSYRTSGNFGVRAIYTVDKDAVAALEAKGYTVIYGAVLGVLANGSTVINSSVKSLTVKVENGVASVATGKGNLAASNAGLSFLTDANEAFAMTITFAEDGSNSSAYDATLIYRGFTAVVDASGNAQIVYDDLAIAENPELNTPSLKAVYSYAKNDPSITEELLAYLSKVTG